MARGTIGVKEVGVVRVAWFLLAVVVLVVGRHKTWLLLSVRNVAVAPVVDAAAAVAA
jgi:hypothetical protein